jgi:peptidoglycan/xylan/chitin deacetylase (PgdA/CDA1 family)
VSDARRVALTFDVEFADRPTGPGATGAILDELAAADVRATMFLQGRWVEAEPVLARRISAEGHVVGNHSHHHARMTILTGAGITRDVRAAETAIEAATGTNPRPWFRCPFGAGAKTERVVRRLADSGYVDVGWHVDPGDWGGVSARTLRRRVVDGVLAHGDGAVVLLHGWPDATPVALAAIIGDLRAASCTFTTVDALDDVPGRRV